MKNHNTFAFLMSTLREVDGREIVEEGAPDFAKATAGKPASDDSEDFHLHYVTGF
jgi:hypothetical protein